MRGQTLAGAGSDVEDDGAEGPAAEGGGLEADGGENPGWSAARWLSRNGLLENE
jgi:hypothetical protein